MARCVVVRCCAMCCQVMRGTTTVLIMTVSTIMTVMVTNGMIMMMMRCDDVRGALYAPYRHDAAISDKRGRQAKPTRHNEHTKHHK